MDSAHVGYSKPEAIERLTKALNSGKQSGAVVDEMDVYDMLGTLPSTVTAVSESN